jgi:hypothetical protein
MNTPCRAAFFVFCLVTMQASAARPAENVPATRPPDSPAWIEAKATLAKEGETLDLTQLLTPGVVDKTNFCAIANLRDLAITIGGKSTAGDPGKRRVVLKAMGSPFEAAGIPSLGHGPEVAQKVDLVSWARYLSKHQLLLLPKASSDVGKVLVDALDLAFPALPYLAKAGGLPNAIFTPAPLQRGVRSPVDGLPPVDFPMLQGVVTLLSLRALAGIDGQLYPDAVVNVSALHKLTLGFANEPLIASQLQAIATTSFGNNAAWHLFESLTASEEQLRMEQDALNAIDFRDSLLRTWRCEMAIFIGAIEATEAVEGGPSVARVFFPGDTGGNSGNLIADLLVTGPPQRVGEAKAAYVSHVYEHCIKPLKNNGLAGFLHEVESNAAAFAPLPIEIARTQPGVFIGRSFLRQIGHLPQVALQAQITTDQARLACAIERFALIEKHHPSSLTELLPKYFKSLPNDLFDGKPMRYRSLEKGRYVLWSVGPNRTDDKGTGDDLVWSYLPATAQ